MQDTEVTDRIATHENAERYSDVGLRSKNKLHIFYRLFEFRYYVL